MNLARALFAVAPIAFVGCSPAPPPASTVPVAIDVAPPSPDAAAPVVTQPAPPPKAHAPSASATTPAAGDDHVQVTILTHGSGAAAQPGDMLLVNYVGTLPDGTEFDSSTKAGRRPFKFKLGGGMVIKGWEQGVVGMQVGEKRRIVIPPALGYGERAIGPLIPPNATLVFEVELLAINPP